MTLVTSAVSGYPQHGVESDETGIYIKNYSASFEPEFIDPLTDKAGERINEARGAVCAKYSISGEQAGTTGLIASTFYAAVTLANDVDGFGLAAGSILLNSAKIEQSSTGWRSFSGEYQRYNNMVASA